MGQEYDLYAPIRGDAFYNLVSAKGLGVRMKTVENGLTIFLHLAIKEYKKWLKMVVKPIETDNFSC
jgi:hypothetical protein